MSTVFTLDDKQRRELWGLGLFALGLLLALSLFPVAAVGAEGVFPAGNVVGIVGRHLGQAVIGFLGVGAVALPLLAWIWGAFAYHRMGPATAFRWTFLLSGLMVIIPGAISVLGATAGTPTLAAGWLGAALAMLLVSLVGTVGGAIVLFFAFAALCVATVGWNPLRSMFHGGRFAVTQAKQA
ncbi:MAG: DNA translocase FtsK 4TM domain-containing protein, partial [Gemmatimonadetes bacterium]|nr:DNA translocase FtsK 4TM domain-containing protein [Gemmatimonadota bacterium]